jgi:hypothetical protein
MCWRRACLCSASEVGAIQLHGMMLLPACCVLTGGAHEVVP